MSMRTKEKNTEVILEIFGAIERRDAQRVIGMVHTDVEFHWPPALCYGPTVHTSPWSKDE